MLRPFPLDQNENGYFANVANTVNNLTLMGGKGVSITKTSGGTKISVTQPNKRDSLAYQSEWSPQNEYFPNDIVVIYPWGNYLDEFGHALAFDTSTTSSYFGTASFEPGIFICRCYIPASFNSASVFVSSIAAAYAAAGGAPNQAEADLYRWNGFNYYYPCYPNLQATQSITTNSGYSFNSGVIFWECIGTFGGGDFIKWAGVYQESSSYKKNDLVYVDPNQYYSIPFEVPDGNRTPPLCAGDFLCIKDVPSASSGSRPIGNYYFPICPTIPSASVVTVSGSKMNDTFWQPLAPMMKATLCIGGTGTSTVYLNGVVSGSTFDLAQLPFPP